LKVVTVAGPHCPDCGVRVNKQHLVGCDVARCIVDGEQHLQHVLFGLDDNGTEEGPGKCCDECAPEVWRGEWPGVREAEQRGWYSILVPGQGWVCVPEGTPDATADLNRVHAELVWDPVTSLYIDPK
jgi:hypothetical protein